MRQTQTRQIDFFVCLGSDLDPVVLHANDIGRQEAHCNPLITRQFTLFDNFFEAQVIPASDLRFYFSE